MSKRDRFIRPFFLYSLVRFSRTFIYESIDIIVLLWYSIVMDSFYSLFSSFRARPSTEAGFNIGGLVKRERCYERESKVSPLWEMVIYGGSKIHRHYLRVV